MSLYIKLFVIVLSSFSYRNYGQSWNTPPILLRISDAIQPSQNFTIYGDGISISSIVYAKLDTDNSNPNTPPLDATQITIIQTDSLEKFIVCKLPNTIPSGIYNIWIQNNFGYSLPIKANLPRILYLSEMEAWQGQKVKIIGRNFSGPEFESTLNTKIRLKNGENTYYQEVTDLNPYKAEFEISSTTPTSATYEVELSNDNGLHWNTLNNGQLLTIKNIGLDLFNLGVSWADEFVYTTYNVNSYGVLANTNTDNTSEIQNVIDIAKANGGGIVYLPNGTYRVRNLKLPSKVILSGEDMYLTKIKYINNNEAILIKTKDDGTSEGKIGLHNLSLELEIQNDSVKTDFVWFGSTTAKKIFAKRISIQYNDTINLIRPGNGRAFLFFADSNVLVKDCFIKGWNANCAFYVKKHVTFSNNYIKNSNGIMVGSYANFTFYDNNFLEGNAPNNTHQNSGLAAHAFSYFENNFVENIGSYSNDGEALLVENPGGSVNYGQVISSNTSSISVATESGNELMIPTNAPFGKLSVLIISGKGLGQLREVLSVSGTTINVTKPWDIVPNTSSKWSLYHPNEGVTWYNNTISNCGAGYIMYGDWYDGVVAKNNAVNSIGISMRGFANNNTFISGYFNRIKNNNISGVSWHVNYGAIGIFSERFNEDGVSKGTQIYGNEIRNNQIYGNPNVIPTLGYTAPNTKACIALTQHIGTNFYGGYYSGALQTRDILNTIIENNTLNNNFYGIEITRGVTAVVECNNSFQNITQNNYWIQNGIETTITQNCENLLNNESFEVKEIITTFPNPTNDELTIIYNSSKEIMNNLSIYSITGSLIVNYSVNEIRKVINLGSIENGIYYLKITTSDKKVLYKKVIKI